MHSRHEALLETLLGDLDRTLGELRHLKRAGEPVTLIPYLEDVYAEIQAAASRVREQSKAGTGS